MSSSFPRASVSMTVQITRKCSTPVLPLPRSSTAALLVARKSLLHGILQAPSPQHIHPPPPTSYAPNFSSCGLSTASYTSIFLVTQSWDYHQPPKSESLLFSSPTTVLPGDATVKNLPAGAGDARHAGSISGWGNSHWVGNGNPHGKLTWEISRRSLVGYSPGGHRVEHDWVRTHYGLVKALSVWLWLEYF